MAPASCVERFVPRDNSSNKGTSFLKCNSSCLRACLHEGGGPQVGEVTCGGLPHLTCKRDHIKMRDYMDRRATPPKRVTSSIWGTPPPCKQALIKYLDNDATRYVTRNTKGMPMTWSRSWVFRWKKEKNKIKDHLQYNSMKHGCDEARVKYSITHWSCPVYRSARTI